MPVLAAKTAKFHTLLARQIVRATAAITVGLLDPAMDRCRARLELLARYGWGGTLAITMNGMSHVARLAPNVLSIAGYSGQGVALATLAAKILSDAIQSTPPSFNLLENVPSQKFPDGVMFR